MRKAKPSLPGPRAPGASHKKLAAPAVDNSPEAPKQSKARSRTEPELGAAPEQGDHGAKAGHVNDESETEGDGENDAGSESEDAAQDGSDNEEDEDSGDFQGDGNGEDVDDDEGDAVGAGSGTGEDDEDDEDDGSEEY